MCCERPTWLHQSWDEGGVQILSFSNIQPFTEWAQLALANTGGQDFRQIEPPLGLWVTGGWLGRTYLSSMTVSGELSETATVHVDRGP